MQKIRNFKFVLSFHTHWDIFTKLEVKGGDSPEETFLRSDDLFTQLKINSRISAKPIMS